MTKMISGLLIIAALMSSSVWAQQKEELTPRIYEIKWQRAEDIQRLLVGMNVEVVALNFAFNTITVRANEQGHIAVADLIRKYDVSEKTIEFQFFIIKARTTGEGLKDGVPERVQKVIRDIAGLTHYKSFEVIDSPFLRTQEGKQSQIEGKGIYDYGIRISVRKGEPVVSAEDKRRDIRVDSFNMSFQVPAVLPDGKSSVKTVGNLSTSFNIIEGDIVVIGASQVEQDGKDPGSAIITVVTATIL